MDTHHRIFIFCLVLLQILCQKRASAASATNLQGPQRHVSSVRKGNHHVHPHSGRRVRRSPLPQDFLYRPELNLTSDEQRGIWLDQREKDAKAKYGQFKLPEGYNKLAIPLSMFREPVYVLISIFIRTIEEVDEQNGEIVLDTDFSMRWVDWKIYESLSDNGWKDPGTNLTLTNRTLDSEILKQIWKPDIFIDEMSTVENTSILSKLITLNFLGDTGGTSRGDIVYSARTRLKLRCDMRFNYFPADTQTCEYHLRSYSYPKDQLELSWVKSPEKAIYLDDPEDANFDLQISSAEPHKMLKELFIEEKFDPYRRGNYSALKFTTYLPSVLLIFITWLCFLIPSSMVEARIGISMTTVLTLTAMFAAVREQSPAVSYTMAIDIFMVFCIFFVFLALLVFTLIYWMKSRLFKIHEAKKNEIDSKRLAEDAEKCSQSSMIPVTTYESFVDLTRKYAFWAFALVFCIFFLTYWAWLLLSSGYLTWAPNLKYTAEFDVDNPHEDDSSNLYLYHSVAQDPDYNSEEERNSTRIREERIRELLNSVIDHSGSSEDSTNPTTMASILASSNKDNGSISDNTDPMGNATEQSIMDDVEMTTLRP